MKNSWGQKGYQGVGSGFYWISYEDGSLQKQLVLSVQMSEKLVQIKPPAAESSRQEEKQEEEEKSFLIRRPHGKKEKNARSGRCPL